MFFQGRPNFPEILHSQARTNPTTAATHNQPSNQSIRINKRRQDSLPSTKAFTLLEIILVLGLITILVSVLGHSFIDMGGSQSLSSGQRIASRAFQSAHALARLRHTQTRVLISKNTDSAPNGQALRKMLLTHKRDEKWELADGEITLPPNIYYVPPEVNEILQNASPNNKSILKSRYEHPAGLTCHAPGEDSSAPANWYFYEFNPNGAAQDSGALFTLVKANPLNKRGSPVAVNTPEQTCGFVIQHNGHLIFLNNYEEIEAALSQ